MIKIESLRVGANSAADADPHPHPHPIETIVAPATPPGEGGIAILRLSGPTARNLAAPLLRLRGLSDFRSAQSRRLYYGHCLEPATGRVVDEVLAVWMKAPTTYTGEDVVEIQGHGGMMPLNEMLRLCLQQGARMAEPGEFTKRAFLNGRIDLTQAEAVMDLIRARSSAASRQALQQLDGVLGERLRQLSADMLAVVALVEAWIDFSEDIGDIDQQRLQESLQTQTTALQELLASAAQGRILRQGIAASIIGLPNVGKSSLLNALLGEERAIVSEYAGTTRDVLEEQISIDGIALKLSDTAGLRQSSDPVERMGVERSEKALAEAELLLLVLDGSRALQDEERQLIAQIAGRPLLVVRNKADLPPLLDEPELRGLLPAGTVVVPTVAQRGQGLTELRQALSAMLAAWSQPRQDALLTRQRHQDAVEAALQHLQQAQDALETGMPYDCLAIDLRAAWICLAELSGEVSSADIIARIFDDFCIGK